MEKSDPNGLRCKTLLFDVDFLRNVSGCFNSYVNVNFSGILQAQPVQLYSSK